MTDAPTPGEAREAGRRKAWWRAFAVLIAGGLTSGLALGIYGVSTGIEPDGLLDSIPGAVVVGALALAILAFAAGCWLYFKAIDELELLDNLWGSIAGFYTYMILFPSWSLLAARHLTGEPNDWVIFFTSLGVGALVYLWRRARLA